MSNPKNKVVVVMGATGTGKSRLAIDLASHLCGEIINYDKIQIYDGLEVVTNKVTSKERATVPHHLLGGIHPEEDFTTVDFRRQAILIVHSITSRGRLPIIVGGSNSYIEELIDGKEQEFQSKYYCCFIWIDMDLKMLHTSVSDRVDQMVKRGLVDEVKGIFNPTVRDYTKGIRRAIGVAEMDKYLRAEAANADAKTKAMLLTAAIDEIKSNTCKLTCHQLQKIHRLHNKFGWDLHRVDATNVFQMKTKKEANDEWEATVKKPSIEIVRQFLNNNDNKLYAEGPAMNDEKHSSSREFEVVRTTI